jgi:hypothetical protein
VLGRTNLIKTGSLLSSLSDSGRQIYIDTAIQAANELLDELYSAAGAELPKSMGESSITLVNADRDYALATDLSQLLWPLLDETNGRLLEKYEAGYHALIVEQLFPDNYTGVPDYALIRPTDGQLYLDRIPQTAEAGIIYKYRYIKDTVLSVLTDVFPCTDAAFRALVPAGAEIINRVHRQKFDQDMYAQSLGRAALLMTQQKPSDSYV